MFQNVNYDKKHDIFREQRGRMGNNPALYSGGNEFKFGYKYPLPFWSSRGSPLYPHKNSVAVQVTVWQSYFT